MKLHKRHAIPLVVMLAALAAGSYAIAGGSATSFNEGLIGYQEVPAVSTVGNGTFTAQILNEGVANDGGAISYRLSYSGLEGSVTQAHIHFGQLSVNGGISVFLCSNLGNGPVGTQACPASPATITGTIRPADVTALAGAQGIAAGQFAELIRAMKAGVTYANVHSSIWPGGEVRAQLDTSS
jgi:CHRD domain